VLMLLRSQLCKHKNYKQYYTFMLMNKRGQLAIIVIMALVIVAVIVVFFAFPQVNLLGGGDVNPSSFLRTCIESDVNEFVEVLSTQGGYLEPDNYILYQDMQVQYLCYTSEDYKPCVVQQPLLVNHIENEIKIQVEQRARTCVNDLKDRYEKQGYTVQTTPGNVEVDIVPGSINIEFDSPMTVTKESTQSFQKFSVGIDSQIYDLLLTAVSIIQFESTYGDSETTLYINYYPDLRIDKIKRDEGTIYKLSNVLTQESFTFATRSLMWPQGYEFKGI
jgi:hypothetical protein